MAAAAAPAAGCRAPPKAPPAAGAGAPNKLVEGAAELAAALPAPGIAKLKAEPVPAAALLGGVPNSDVPLLSAPNVGVGVAAAAPNSDGVLAAPNAGVVLGAAGAPKAGAEAAAPKAGAGVTAPKAGVDAPNRGVAEAAGAPNGLGAEGAAVLPKLNPVEPPKALGVCRRNGEGHFLARAKATRCSHRRWLRVRRNACCAAATASAAHRPECHAVSAPSFGPSNV